MNDASFIDRWELAGQGAFFNLVPLKKNEKGGTERKGDQWMLMKRAEKI